MYQKSWYNLTHAQSVCTRLSFPSRPAPSGEPGFEASTHTPIPQVFYGVSLGVGKGAESGKGHAGYFKECVVLFRVRLSDPTIVLVLCYLSFSFIPG